MKVVKFVSTLVLSALFGLSGMAQDLGQDPVLMKIDNKPVSKSEFERIYRKNNPEGQKSDQKALDEYVELFINFKLKVAEAQAQKLDTNSNFIRELGGYRKQLANPYLVDRDVDESLLKEAYDRKLWDVRASHILINLEENATDTMAAWKKINDIRKKAIAGESFDTLAYKFSNDPSAKTNYGDLGYFTVFQMVYQFESIAYNTPVGQISEIFRTKFGYHIVKINDKRKSKGEVKVAHIMVALPKDADKSQQEKAEAKIREAYNSIKNGTDFAKLAEEMSDDKTSGKKGGELNWFGTGRMVPEFEKASFAIEKIGDVCEPIRTQFGWHIIKKLDEKPIAAFDALKAELKTKVTKDGRSQRSRTALVAALKKEYNFKELPKNFQELYKTVDTTIFENEDNLISKFGKPIFTLGDSTYLQNHFVNFMRTTRKKEKPEINKVFIDKSYADFVEKTIIAYEEARLDVKYPDFKYLMQEYHDGILLFDLTDRMVWNKAVKDTTGIEEFYQKNKNNYMWPKRVDVSIYSCANDKCKDLTVKYLTKNINKGISEEALLKAINVKETNDLSKVSQKLYAEGDDANIDKYIWQNQTIINSTLASFVVIENNQILVFNKMVQPEPKQLNEAKGLITADYQTFLEKEWIKSLREKYKVEVDQTVLKTIKP